MKMIGFFGLFDPLPGVQVAMPPLAKRAFFEVKA
jgi:hypothetical protein